MKGILPIWLRRSSQKSSTRLKKVRQRRSATILQLNLLEDRVVLASSVSYFLPSPYASGAYLPVGQVDRARVSFIPDNADWTVDPSSFTALDVSITLNGGSPINLSNGSPGEYKIGVVSSETYQNSFWLIGLPRATLATGDYQLSINGSINWLDQSGSVVSTETISSSAGTVSWQQRGGSVAAWGGNASGQSNVPANLTSATNVVSVAAGLDYGLALKSDGTVQAWGTGQVATTLPNLSGVVQISGGNTFAIALKADGTVQAWGLNTSGSVADAPTSGNYFAVNAGYATGGAIGDTNSTNIPTESFGTDGTLVTWGQNTASTGTNSMYVIPDTIQGLVQVSLGNDFMVGVRSDGSFWGYTGSSIVSVPAPAYNPDATYIQAVAGQKSTGTVERYSLTISNSYDTGSSYTTTGYGQNNYGTVNPANVTGAAASFTSAIWDGNAANGTANIAANTSFNINSLSQLATGDLSVIGLSSNSNQIKGWGYNGGVTPDGRVTGGLTYSASGSKVGFIDSGATNTIVQVMDLTQPTLSSANIVPQAPTTTGTFPIVWQANFSEPIDLTTFTTGNCEVVYANGTAVSGFPISSISLANGTTSAYNITVGANTTIPANFNGVVYLKINNPNGSTYIRDIAGNTLANSPSITSTNGITIATSGFSTACGTLFNNAQWVQPGVLNYTLSFSSYANITQATTTSNYDFTQLTGSLPNKTILSITANENVSGTSRSFAISVLTGNPVPTSSTASFQVYLKPNTVLVGGSLSPQVDSNTAMVDNISPLSISSITPCTANGTAVSSPYAISTGVSTIYYKVSFNDYVQFQGAAGSISNFFSFSYSAFAGVNTASAFVSTVTNAASAAYAQDWIVQVAVTGQGVIDMTVKSSYTSGATTYGIVNPVGSSVSANGTSSPDWTVMTKVYTKSDLVNTYNSNATTTVTGLNPTNNTPAYFGAPAGVTFNTAQRSRVAKTQFNLYAPVANLTSTATPVTGSDFKLQVWTGNNTTGSFVDYNTGKIPANQISINVDNRWGAGATNYYSTYDLSFRLGSAPTTEMWTLPNGYYQIVLVNPSVIKNIDGVAAGTGDTAYQSQFEFWRIFGNGDGRVPGGFPSEVAVTADDYNYTLLAYANGNSYWAKWNLFSLIYQDPNDPFTAVSTDDYNQVLLNYARGVYLDGRVIMNL